MSGSLKNKLLQFEAVPPSRVWEEISAQLNEEFVAADSLVADKLENASVAPPFGMFDKIEAGLHEVVPGRVVPMYRKFAVAAAVIGVFILGGIYFLKDTTSKYQELVNNNTLLEHQDTANDTVAESLPIPSTGGVDASVGTQIKTLLRRGRGGSPQTHAQLASFTDIDIDDPKPVQMISATEPVHVAAPPIRDEKGNVIMDPAIISTPNEPYITVTSPNGSQTKISNKFLSCLSYLNGNFSASEINYEGQQWKSRFAEWRNKLSEAGFVPGANNFFDIFELQELIRD
jgi:hypothetical protein